MVSLHRRGALNWREISFKKNQLAPIMKKMHCILKYEYADRCNCMVDLIKKGDYVETGINVTATEIPQCPPKDARREILNIGICPDDAVSLHYHIRVKNIHEHDMLHTIFIWQQVASFAKE
jgi:hypothetical protein